MPRVAYFGGVSARAFGLNGRVAGLFSVGASPTSTSVSSGYDGGSKTTPSVTVFVTAGVATGLTFAWTKVSGGGTITCNSPAAATTTFTATPPSENSSISQIWRCTVHNSLGQVAAVDVPVVVSATLAALTVSVTNGFHYNPPSGSSFSFGVGCSASGGTPPYTYSWAPSGNISPVNTSSSTYTSPSNSPGAHEGIVITCSVTDSIGRFGQANGLGSLDWV